MNSREIIDLLREGYGPPEWEFLAELRCGTGYGRKCLEGRMDAWAINCYGTKARQRIAFEIKTSRSDFTRELRAPLKRRPALLLSNLFYFVASEGIIKPEDLPAECGLIEIIPYREKDDTNLVVRDIAATTPAHLVKYTVAAPWRDTPPPPWHFVASAIRHTREQGSYEK